MMSFSNQPHIGGTLTEMLSVLEDIIHTVPPKDGNDPEKLAKCITNALRLAKSRSLKSIVRNRLSVSAVDYAGFVNQ
jgi:O-acetyl-ADP-ribose deacetylase (regulator of RNase III)